MCYICEARGNVGANYKATQKTIAGALKALGPTPPAEWGTHIASWGDRHGSVNAPRVKLWSAADLKAYGKAYREERNVTP